MGSIVNSGTITAKTGIALYASTITSGIIDSGSIKATSHGILIERASEVLSSKTAIDIAGPTFTGDISNSGVVSGSACISIKSAHSVSIFDGGVIVGTGGTAIEFAGSGNTLRSAPVQHWRYRRSFRQPRRERLRYVRSQLDRA